MVQTKKYRPREISLGLLGGNIMIFRELDNFINMIEDIYAILKENIDDHTKVEKIEVIVNRERDKKIRQATISILQRLLKDKRRDKQ